MIHEGQTGQRILRCDICNISCVWIPKTHSVDCDSFPARVDELAKRAGWVAVVVPMARLAVCTVCQGLASAIVGVGPDA